MAANKKKDPVYEYRCGVILPGTHNELEFTIRSETPPKNCGEHTFFITKKNGAVLLIEKLPNNSECLWNEDTFAQLNNKVYRCSIPDAIVTEPDMYVELSGGLKDIRAHVPSGIQLPLEERGCTPIEI